MVSAPPAAEGERTGECFNAAKAAFGRIGERAVVLTPPAAEGERTGECSNACVWVSKAARAFRRGRERRQEGIQ